ncbi:MULTISPECIES: universal stress protein [Streptomyces]|uniref:Universal stress protein n=2 Tax=Streptomyces TaxID=1883 RepID=A0ABU4KFD7_9ACTN|nr:universal stress protein [Streptomyces roseolus]MDX2296416.1 universal stress protein [Streptomyces roseolus]
MAAVQRPSGLDDVVVRVDGSEGALSAVLWAAEEALLRGSRLFLVHATDTEALTRYLFQAEIDESRRTGRELLARTAVTVSARHPDVLVVEELSDRPPSEALRHAAALSGTIVVGHRGRGGFASLLLGSVGLRTAATVDRPVVVVRGHSATGRPGAVLAAVRDDHDLGCARAAAREALLRQRPLRLLHVWRIPWTRGERTASRDHPCDQAADHVLAQARMEVLLRDEFPDLKTEIEGARNPSVAAALVEATRDACLLVADGHRGPGYLWPILGRTTLALLQHAHCPVELIPRHAPGHGSTS